MLGLVTQSFHRVWLVFQITVYIAVEGLQRLVNVSLKL